MLHEVYNAPDENGYHAVERLNGSLYTEDHTYITFYPDARKKITVFDRDELLRCGREVYRGK